jgi:lipopolysaccharide export system permease protein
MLFHSSLRKELARSFGATLVILVTVVMTMTLIRTLGQAARGGLNPSDVILVMGFNVLTFMPNIMTMGLFVATVATLSRRYQDSEMVIWFSSGVSLQRLISPLFRFAWPVLAGIAVLSLMVLPWANRQIEEMRTRFENRGDLERVQPGQFQESANGSRVFFVEKSLVNPNTASNVFIATKEHDKETITSAKNGRIEINDNERYLVLNNGQRLESSLDRSDLKLVEFETYRIRVSSQILASTANTPLNIRPTHELLQNPTLLNLGELSWRMGFALAAANLLLVALVISRVNPRRGRSGNLVFALLMFQVYLNLLNLGQAWISAGQVQFFQFQLIMHGGVLLVALLWLQITQRLWRMPGYRGTRRSSATASAGVNP